ncbi:MAG: sodium:proton antiporter [Chromatiales bacterium]|nr:MAG: sodium:proton antiporter [Chromatiales bacterium]
MTNPERDTLARLARFGSTLAVALVFAGLAFAMLSLPAEPTGLAAAVRAELPGTGAANPVTAVLLNFRGYDTLLEIAVLLLALLAIWTMRRGQLRPQRDPGDVLESLASIQAPVMLVVAGYLLWAGGSAPGGAFQAGGILAAAGVMLVLAGSGWPQRLSGWPLRVALVLGLSAFICVGVAVVLGGQEFLAYPASGAATIILVLEICATVSIAVILLDMFLSVLRGRASRTDTTASIDQP